MTTLQLILADLRVPGRVGCRRLHFTRPTSRPRRGGRRWCSSNRVFRAGAIVSGNALALWRVPLYWTPVFLVLFYLAFVVSAAPIYLVTWRLARRFGWRGLAVFTCIVTIIGPPRDYLFAAVFPAWMVFAPGVAPILADAAAYVGIVVVGHAVMSLIAAPPHVWTGCETNLDPGR